MGLPAFYRWFLRTNIPSSQSWMSSNKSRIPSTRLNLTLNGLEFDNLYLDMNGIIHPSLPSGRPEDRVLSLNLHVCSNVRVGVHNFMYFVNVYV
jgi:5'-3' exonuclease